MQHTESFPDLTVRVQAAFSARFSHPPAGLTQAPGRVNLIGEHTDYNGGFVLPCAIDRHVVAAWAPRHDGQVVCVAADQAGQSDAFRLDAPIAKSVDAPWANYLRGMVRELAAHLSLRGEAGLSGVSLAIAGNVPAGAGLSSSAAFELAVGHALLAAWGLSMDATELALLAQRAENDFVGCRCGVMDQLVSARAVAGAALLIDCRSLQAQPVALPPDTAILVAHSRVRRGLVESSYNERRVACERAAGVLGVAALRDASMDDVAAGGLDPVTRRRASHVVSENSRTVAAASALARGDLREVGALMRESHVSMRDDFEITVPAIDELVAIMNDAIGELGGARMTGGGFGGCVVAVMPGGRVERVTNAVLRSYRSPDGLPALLFQCLPSTGAGRIT